MCAHESGLSERYACVALGKEGSCSSTAEHRDTPRSLGFHSSEACSRSQEEGTKFFSKVALEPGL